MMFRASSHKVAQWQTVEIARDVARRLFEAASERKMMMFLPEVADAFDYPVVIGA
jgi:hypothetical protein